MQSVIGLLVLIGSVLAPQRQWMAPQAPVMVNVQSEEPVKLMLTDFTGRIIGAEKPELARLSSTQSVDVRQIFPDVLSRPGTYVLWMVPPAAEDVSQFGSTPLVIEVRRDTRPGAPEGPMVIHVSPLSLVSMQTNFGPMEMVFYYDVAPNTVANFLTLVNQGFYDGLTFHRVIKGFVIQGGDPRGDGSGSPGYTIPAEFNDRPHHEGVLSMARQGDPNERTGAMPRPEYADSASSQFFICLDYAKTRNLDRRYTAFGQIATGMDSVHKIADTPVQASRPEQPVIIESAKVIPVTQDHNPYVELMHQLTAAQQNLSEPTD